MNLTYRCTQCDEEIDLNLKYSKYVSTDTDDTIEDYPCSYCGYENMIEVLYKVS